MEIIPLITIEKRKIIQKSFSSFKTNTKKGENKIYILDLDGIKKIDRIYAPIKNCQNTMIYGQILHQKS